MPEETPSRTREQVQTQRRVDMQPGNIQENASTSSPPPGNTPRQRTSTFVNTHPTSQMPRPQQLSAIAEVSCETTPTIVPNTQNSNALSPEQSVRTPQLPPITAESNTTSYSQLPNAQNMSVLRPQTHPINSQSNPTNAHQEPASSQPLQNQVDQLLEVTRNAIQSLNHGYSQMHNSQHRANAQPPPSYNSTSRILHQRTRTRRSNAEDTPSIPEVHPQSRNYRNTRNSRQSHSQFSRSHQSRDESAMFQFLQQQALENARREERENANRQADRERENANREAERAREAARQQRQDEHMMQMMQMHSETKGPP